MEYQHTHAHTHAKPTARAAVSGCASGRRLIGRELYQITRSLPMKDTVAHLRHHHLAVAAIGRPCPTMALPLLLLLLLLLLCRRPPTYLPCLPLLLTTT